MCISYHQMGWQMSCHLFRCKVTLFCFFLFFSFTESTSVNDTRRAQVNNTSCYDSYMGEGGA